MEVVAAYRSDRYPYLGAKCNDSSMPNPTFDNATKRGPLCEIETIWLDYDYDSHVTREPLTERSITDNVTAIKTQSTT